jgi:hypothetical protein
MRPLPNFRALFALAVAACCFLLLAAQSASAAIAFRAGTTNQTGAGANSLVINRPAGTASGDVMIATVNTVGALPGAPAGWNPITSTTSPGWTGAVVTYYKVAGGAEPASYTWTLGGSVRAAGAIAGFSGVDNTYPIAGSNSAAVGLGSSADTPSVSTLASNSTVIANATYQRTGIATTVFRDASTNAGPNVASTSSPREGVYTSYLTQASAGATAAQTFTSTSNVLWQMQTIALTPSGGSYSFPSPPDLPNLPSLTLNGSAQTLTAAMPGFGVDDETGSKSGWKVTVNGDNGAGKSPVFARYCPNAGGCGSDAQGYPAGGAAFAAQSLTLNTAGGSFSGGVGTAPSFQCGSSCALDVTNPVKVVSASANGGSATWTSTALGGSSVSLSAPTTVKALPASEVYRLDLLWTLATGP